MCAHLWHWLAARIPSTVKSASACRKTHGGDESGISAATSTAGSAARQLAPFVSTKSWCAMRLASAWCSRNGRTNQRPRTGVRTLPKVSNAQWTSPLKRSAAVQPASAAAGIAQPGRLGCAASWKKPAAASTAKVPIAAVSSRRWPAV